MAEVLVEARRGRRALAGPTARPHGASVPFRSGAAPSSGARPVSTSMRTGADVPRAARVTAQVAPVGVVLRLVRLPGSPFPRQAGVW